MAASTVLHFDHHHLLAKNFMSAVNLLAPPYYMFFGRSIEWTDELAPPTAEAQNYAKEYELRNNMTYLSRLRATELSYAIGRNDWQAGKIFDKYRPDYSPTNPAFSGATDIFTSTNLVMNSQYRLYKCIDNNNNSISTIEPTGDSLTYFTTSDGYVWRYITTLTDAQRLHFLTDRYVPLQSAIPAALFYNGVEVVLENGGNGYDPKNTIITISGDGIDAHLRPIIAGDVIIGVEVINPGANYTYATVEVVCPDLTKPRGTGAAISLNFPFLDLTGQDVNVQLTTTSGDISSIEVTNGGSNYTFDNTIVTITGDGTGATARPIVENGVVVGITPITRGEGYSYAIATIGGDGNGATAEVIVSPNGGHGHDIVEETRARVVCIRKAINEINMHSVATWLDFRQCGIIAQPDQVSLSGGYRNYFDDQEGTTGWAINSSSIAKNDYTYDEKLIRITDLTIWYVAAAEDNRIVLYSLDKNEISPGDQFASTTVITDPVTGLETLATDAFRFTVDSVEKPQVEKFSGTILYYDNREVYHEVEDSTAIVQTFIEF